MEMDARARLYERSDREEWETERAHLREKNKRLTEELARTAKLLKMTQAAMVEQQKLLDRFQNEFAARAEEGSVVKVEASMMKRSASSFGTKEDKSREIKRVKTEASAGKQRRSLPLEERHSNHESPSESNPRRRRSLPVFQRPLERRSDSGKVNLRDTWMARKADMDAKRRTVINQAETLRSNQLPSQPTRAPSSHHTRRQNDALRKPSDSMGDFFSDGEDQQRDRQRAPHERERTLVRTGRSRDQPQAHIAQRRELPFRMRTDSRAPHSTRASEKENTFAYVEVVRNRDARAALPGHNCAECRKYYEALDGLVSESDMKAKCSRHRARFEPYHTPDDFWRLSFPDSHTENSPSP